MDFLDKFDIVFDEEEGSIWYREVKNFGTSVTDEVLENLANLNVINKIEIIECSNVTGIFLSKLNRHPIFSLKMIACPITDSGAECLSAFPQLEVLTLTATSITDTGISFVANCVNLNYLQLTSREVTNEGLLKLSNLKKLSRLELYLPKVTGSAYEHLQSQLPNCFISATLDNQTYYMTGEGVQRKRVS